MSELEQRLVERIHREGPIPFDAYVEAALYGDGGFFASGHGAGRAGADFVTSPEVGQLFGALVARHVDRVWDALGRPDPFVVVEAGAGRGRLAADVLAAAPECAPALRYVLVERSAGAPGRTTRAAHRRAERLGIRAGSSWRTARPSPCPSPVRVPSSPRSTTSPRPTSRVSCSPTSCSTTCRSAWWSAPRSDGRRFGSTTTARVSSRCCWPHRRPSRRRPTWWPREMCLSGARLPVPTAARDWLHRAAALLRRGRVLLVDYAASGAELADRGQDGWLRTYRTHERGGSAARRPRHV